METLYDNFFTSAMGIFVIIHILKELKMPLKDIRDYLDHRTTAHMIDIAEKKIPHIEQELTKLKQIQHVLQKTSSYAVEGQEAKQGEI
ncbi:MerR family DNA-binding protein [Paenibacillus sp. Z6-24]